MTTSRYLSIDYAESYNLLQSSAYSLDRRRSFGELNKLPSETQMRLSNLYEDKKKWKSNEMVINDPELSEKKQETKGGKDEKNRENEENEEKVEVEEEEEEEEGEEEEDEEDTITQDEDEKMFMEYQRCAMASRRRKSFNDVGEVQNTIPIFKDKKVKYSQSESESNDDSRRSSVVLTTPEISIESLSTQPSPTSSIYIAEENRVVLSPNSGWNRLKRMFKENKLKEQPMGYLNKPAMAYNSLRRGSCDSPLQLSRANKLTLPDRSSIPDTIFSSYTLDEMTEEETQPLNTKTDGWARFKKKFKDGKLKPMMDENSSNGKFTKQESNGNTVTSKVDSPSYKSSGNGTKKIKKGAKADIIGENALHNAIIEGDLNAVKRIIESGKVDINFLKPPGLTPLHVACAFGNIKIIELLISNGADVKIKTWSRISSLQVSTLFGHFEVCQYLISNGANSLDVQDGFVHDLKLMSSVLVK